MSSKHMNPARHAVDGWQWTAARPDGNRGWLGMAAIALALAWVLHWSAAGAQMSWSELANGMPQIGDFLSRSVPPDWSMLPRLWAPALETIQIAIWGTLLSVILALPLSFVAAGNLHSWHWLRRITRQFLNVIRSINELILALVFVSAVGLGPFPGVLALALTLVSVAACVFWEWGYRKLLKKPQSIGDLSAVVTGIAGLLSALNTGFVSPESLHWSVSAITLLMVVVGGFKRAAGPIVGAIVYFLFKDLLGDWATHSMAIFGAALIAVIVFSPDGITGALARLLRRLRHGPSKKGAHP